ncbi:MAG TPA: glycosyltransferase family 39 protein [Patescibacteria group bacterium]|nr:glycosyltransferase family 39 protein [Patescibacteria group bacterium]
MRKNFWQISFALTLILGLFLRVYKIGSNYFFTGELGKELLYMRQFAIKGTLPLTGMATSHEWLSYGPIYYWIMIPVFKLFNGNPYILFWSAFTVAILGLALNYFVIKRIANEKIAMLSTMIQTFSPLLIWQTRLSKLHVFFFLLMPVFTYLLYLMWETPSSAKASEGRGKWVFWAGLTFGILFSFHFSQIPILGVVILLFLIKKELYKVKDWFLFGLGVVLPNITLLWQDKSLALWLPYRVINFADKNPGGTLFAITEYFGKTIFWNQGLWIIGLLIFAAVFFHYIYVNKERLSQDFLPFYLISSISLMLVANILHGAPPVHYFLPIFTTVPILFAIYLSKIKFSQLIIFLILLTNLVSFGNDPLFFGDSTKFIPAIDFVPYGLQKTIASFIVFDSKGNDMSIRRIGPYDYFPEQYSQNYKYLIIESGGKLLDTSGNTYMILESTQSAEITVEK